MRCRYLFGWLLAAAVFGLTGFLTAQEKKEDKKGTVTGVVTNKGGNWIEVKADGEEKARKYFTGSDQAALKAVKATEIDSRIRMDWRFSEVFRVVKIEVLKAPGKVEKKDEKKEKDRKGTVTGVVTAKGDNWIEVKADGEEKARRYVPQWKGGLPKDGGGPDKGMVAQIKKVPLKSRVRIEWLFEERPRVMKIEVLKKPDGPVPEKRSGTIAGEIKSKKEQGNNIVIEVLAPGEEKARSYFVQHDPKLKAPIPSVLKVVREAKVGDKVVFDWEATGHGPAIVKFEVLKKGSGGKK
ncbi:MAG: hypothetical protein L0241_16135 [Planctomycetia bacterium]|nr:hypothetical protein [Planctomycetia bacterium]